MQYNPYRPLNGLIDREKFSRQLKINCMESHVELAHDWYFGASVNFLNSPSKICRTFFLNYLASDQLFLTILVGAAENPNNRQIKPRCVY